MAAAHRKIGTFFRVRCDLVLFANTMLCVRVCVCIEAQLILCEMLHHFLVLFWMAGVTGHVW